jgi:hypothetical protein
VLQVTRYGAEPGVGWRGRLASLGLGGGRAIQHHGRSASASGAWLVAQKGLVLATILLCTLIVAALEMQLGITPLDESAAWWTLSGE